MSGSPMAVPGSWMTCVIHCPRLPGTGSEVVPPPEPPFFQVELGLEHQLNDSRDDTTDLLVGVGAGIALSQYIAILSELSLISELRDDDDDRELLPSLDIGMRYHDPRVMAGARLHLPFAEQFRDGNVLAFILDAAVRF